MCCVHLCVQELGRSPFPVVRNNIMVALSDMLIQYTALVDAHMPRLAACIRCKGGGHQLEGHGSSSSCRIDVMWLLAHTP